MNDVSETLRIAGIGEILMDRFEDGVVTLGGAPLNVTFHVHQLLRALRKGKAAMVSRVGRDAWGEYILARLSGDGLDTSFVQVDAKHPTGSANVFRHGPEAGFEIVPDVAYDYMESSRELGVLAAECQAVVFGSLAQRAAVSRKTIQGFVAAVPGHRLYDVNLRRNTTDGVASYSDEILAESLDLATVVKTNDAEIEEIAAVFQIGAGDASGEERTWALMEQLLERYHLAAIAVTRGPKGALYLSKGARLRTADSTLPQDQVHPVGAGDSFAAGLLYGLVRDWPPELCLELASTLSSWVVTQIAATPVLTPEMLTTIHAVAAKAAVVDSPSG